MRRMVAAATALLAAIALSVTPVLAQDSSGESAPEMTYVTGTEMCGALTPPPTTTEFGYSTRGSTMTCRDEMSDPRVSGTWTNTFSSECYAVDLCLFWGTHVLDTPEGGWDCSWAGSNYPVGEPDAMGDWPILLAAVCPGTGGYEGLSYVFQHSDTNFLERSSFNGVIYEGAPPPLEMRAPAE